MLIAAGCVAPGYQASMGRREALANTFLGHGVAIPHGLGEDRHLMRRDGIAVLQLPEGVEWNPGQVTRLVVGIAAQSDTHITLLRRLTRLIQDEATLQRLFTTSDASEIVNALASDVAVSATHVPVADLAERFDWTIAYPSGLHARPATRWAETARGFTARAQVRAGDQAADAKSLVALLQLGLREGDAVRVSAEGADAPHCWLHYARPWTGWSRRKSPMRSVQRSERRRRSRAGIRPKRRQRSSASAPAPGWPSVRCMYWPARRPMLPIALPRLARRRAPAGCAQPYPPAAGRASGRHPAPPWRLGCGDLQGAGCAA